MTRALLIDSAMRCVRPVEFEGLAGMQKWVGGSLTIATQLPRGDIVYVDEEGLHKPQKGFFKIRGADQPLAGNGLVVGREVELDQGWGHGWGFEHAPPFITLGALTSIVKFLTRSRAQVRSGQASAEA